MGTSHRRIMRLRPNDIESAMGKPSRYRRLGAALLLLVCVGLVFAASLEALRPLCGGRVATIASNDRMIQGTRGPDVIVGGRGPNVIFGAGGNDVICGGFGRDRIHGKRGNDTIDGKRDADVVHGGRGSDEVDGGADRDEVFGDSGNDAVHGGPGNRDDADGGPGDDHVTGGRGSFDAVLGGIGNDRIDGGRGRHDIASYRTAGGPIEADLASGTVVGAEQERLSGIEDVLGGSGEDTLAGSETTANRLDGGPGDDRLFGPAPGDKAFGGPGSDQCLGAFAVEDSCGPSGSGGTRVELYESIAGSSSLIVVGDGRYDEVAVRRGDRGYVVRGGSGNPVLLGTSASRGCGAIAGAVACGGGSVTSILVSLGGSSDLLRVDDSVPAEVSVTVDGGPGADWLRGGRGADTLYSGDDDDPDVLDGAGGDDALFGVNILHPRHSSGAATLVGGAGDDLLIGGQPCADLFHGGKGDNDSASFARVRNAGIVVKAAIGGRVFDPDAGYCGGSRIDGTVEKIEGSTGPDVLLGAAGPDTLLGRGGPDVLDGRGRPDRCVGGRGRDRARHCEYVR
jgi:Ca2+-binding RTX toxin-like protein